MLKRILLSGNKSAFLILFISSLLVLASCSKDNENIVSEEFAEYKGKYLLLVNKRKFQLYVYSRKEGLIRTFKIGYGKNKDLKPKIHEGDNRTPEGRYEIREILSMDASPQSQSFKKLQIMNKHYFRAKDGYHKIDDKKADLGDNAYGPRFFEISYPNDADGKKYKSNLEKGNIPLINGNPKGIGYGIGIHGNSDEKSIGENCSSGCIRMYNRDVVELDRYIVIGTPVIIVSR